jgi:hypothetical protein
MIFNKLSQSILGIAPCDLIVISPRAPSFWTCPATYLYYAHLKKPCHIRQIMIAQRKAENKAST